MNEIPRSILVPAALLAGLCPLVANSLYEDEGGDATEILADAAAGLPVAGQVSIVLFLIGFAAFVVVLGALATAIHRQSPVLAWVAGIAGAASVAIKLAEAQTGMALRQSAGEADPATAEVLVAMDEAGFTVYGFLFTLALGAAGLGLLRGRVGPAWLARSAFVLGGLGVVTAVIGIVEPAAYVPIPYLLLLLWLIALGITGARRPFVEVSSASSVVAR